MSVESMSDEVTVQGPEMAIRDHSNVTKQTTNKADCSQFFIAQTTHCNTHVLYMEATQDTHAHTHTHTVSLHRKVRKRWRDN